MIDKKKLLEELSKKETHLFNAMHKGFMEAVGIVRKQPEVSEWIPVEHPPKDNVEQTLIQYENGEMEMAPYYGNGVWDIWQTDKEVVAWMYIEPYKPQPDLGGH